MKLKLTDIHIDGGTQPREDIDVDVVKEYADAMQEGDEFPPIVVFNDGAKKWLADGFHRYHASNYLGFLEIESDVKSGTKRDAILYSVSANSKHGLRRINADKRKAVLTLLNDEEWSGWSNYEIADQCGVSEFLVRKMRDETTTIKSQSGERIGKDGRTIDTTNIGKRDIFGKKVKQGLDDPSDYEETEDTGYDIDDGQTIVTDLPDNVDPETGEILTKEKPVGLQKAYEAITKLQEIPADDEEMLEAFGLVVDWINRNK